MSAIRPLVLFLILWLGHAGVASAETWSTTASKNGVDFTVRLKNPKVIRKVPLVDGIRWDIQVSNSVRNRVTKHLARAP